MEKTHLTNDELSLFKRKALQWSKSFHTCLLLDNNASENAFGLHEVEFILAAGVKKELTCDIGTAFDSLKRFRNQLGGTLFGYFTYDLKNEIERLHSAHPDGLQFPALYFFEPEYLLIIDNQGKISGDIDILNQIEQQEVTATKPLSAIQLQQRVSREEYVKNVQLIREHIIEGDVYEVNYCVEFYAQHVLLDAADMYQRLKEKSPTPFGGFFRNHDHYLLCASPERFMKKKGNKLYSQPIKGTAKRGRTIEEDEQLKLELLHSEKERAENLMIVDLVRNDMARSSQTGSVKVEELFGIYSFPQVHQMISTVSSTIKENTDVIDIIKQAFPMGSMTGAPKIMAMELIEKYETTKRGLYSGAIGYITPEGDFDLNVVIRSLQYHAGNQYLSFEVGSAITFDSDPQQEYEECLLKAKAMREVLGNE